MGQIVQALGAIIIGLVVLGGAATGIYNGMSKGKISTAQENLIILRTQVQQFFSGTNYEGLTNDTAIKAGLYPDAFVKNNASINPWSGSITLTANDDATFNIEFQKVPQKECNQMALFQSDSWEKVVVNGSEVDIANIAALADSCANKENTVTYTAQ